MLKLLDQNRIEISFIVVQWVNPGVPTAKSQENERKQETRDDESVEFLKPHSVSCHCGQTDSFHFFKRHLVYPCGRLLISAKLEGVEFWRRGFCLCCSHSILDLY